MFDYTVSFIHVYFLSLFFLFSLIRNLSHRANQLVQDHSVGEENKTVANANKRHQSRRNRDTEREFDQPEVAYLFNH